MQEVWRHLWDALCRAPHDRRAAFRTPTLATLAQTPEGKLYPRARTVVLRQAERKRARLIVHSDQRAAKIAEIERCPVVALCFWDKRLHQQVRCEAEAQVFTTTGDVDQAWAGLGPRDRAIYAASPTPGLPCPPPAPTPRAPGPPPARHNDRPADLANARQHFALISFRVHAVDWLSLDGPHHRRALFRRHNDGVEGWRGAWIAP